MKITPEIAAMMKRRAHQELEYENRGKVIRSVPAKKEWRDEINALEDEALAFVEKLSEKREKFWAKVAKELSVDTDKHGLLINGDGEIEVIEE